jgi:hypothetical protein
MPGNSTASALPERELNLWPSFYKLLTTKPLYLTDLAFTLRFGRREKIFISPQGHFFLPQLQKSDTAKCKPMRKVPLTSRWSAPESQIRPAQLLCIPAHFRFEFHLKNVLTI